jgi:hypothetical protein
MSIYFVIAAMVFMHVLDDYVLQAPCLCNLKQKSFWEQNAPGEFYEFDYVMALIMHGFSWAFMVMLPIAIALSFNIGPSFLIMLIFNALFHAFIDDLKANQKLINLWGDQLCHMVQIGGTFLAFIEGCFVC